MDQDRDLYAVRGAEFGEQPRDVRLDRRLAHEQQGRPHTWQILVSIAVWVVVPLVLGLVRTTRREIK